MVNFKNPGDTPVGVPGTEIFAGPGEVIGVPDGYALPRRIPGTDTKRPSVIEMTCPQLHPASDRDRLRVSTEFAEDVQARRARVPQRTKEALMAMGINPAIAELMAAKDLGDLASKAPGLVANLEAAKKAAREEAQKAIAEMTSGARQGMGNMSVDDAAAVLQQASGTAPKGRKKAQEDE